MPRLTPAATRQVIKIEAVAERAPFLLTPQPFEGFGRRYAGLDLEGGGIVTTFQALNAGHEAYPISHRAALWWKLDLAGKRIVRTCAELRWIGHDTDERQGT